jgi:hypothetical protein
MGYELEMVCMFHYCARRQKGTEAKDQYGNKLTEQGYQGLGYIVNPQQEVDTDLTCWVIDQSLV